MYDGLFLAGGYATGEASTSPAPPPSVSHEEEFMAFATSAGPDLVNTAWLLCGDRHLAEELVAEALERTGLAWDEARERDRLAYARRVLVAVRVELWRRRRREWLASAPERARVGAERRVATVRDHLGRTLATLAPHHRRNLALRYLAMTRHAPYAAAGTSTPGTRGTAPDDGNGA